LVLLLDFRRWGILGRLYAMGGLAVFSVLLLAGAAVYFAASTSRAYHALYDSRLLAVAEAADLVLLLERHRRIVDASIGVTDGMRLAESMKEAAGLVEEMQHLASRDGGPLADRVGSTLTQVGALGLAAMSNDEEGSRAPRAGAHRGYVVFAEELQREFTAFRAERLAAANAETSTLSHSAQRLVSWVTLLACMTLLLIGPLNVILIRDVARRFQDVTRAMGQLARNDTAVAIPTSPADDEISEIAKAVAVFKANAVTLLDQKVRLEQLNL
jgi:hypothetical protein